MFKFLGSLFGGQQAPDRKSEEPQRPTEISIHNAEAIAAVKSAAQLASSALSLVEPAIVPGVLPLALDAQVHEFLLDKGATPVLLGYRGYRHSIVCLVNHAVTGGVPDERPLREGDIASIGVSVRSNGMHANATRTFAVGAIPPRCERLIAITEVCLHRGIEAIKPDGYLCDYGCAVQSYAESQRCGVVRDFCGHGVGAALHEPPSVLNYGRPGEGLRIKPGMAFVLMPMLTLGRHHVKVLADGWTAVTRDRSLSASASHTVVVTETGCEILT